MSDDTPSADPDAPPGEPSGPYEADGAREEGGAEGDDERGLGDFRRDLSALAARPGSTNERISAEKSARAELSTFAGAGVRSERAYGGDHFEFRVEPDGTRVRMYRLFGDELEEVRSAFAAPLGFDELTAAAASASVALLTGPEGAGKYAAARALLVGAGHPELYRLAPDTDLAGFVEDDVVPGAGYLLVDAPRTLVETLGAFEVQRLERLLAPVGCRLIITFPAGVRPNDPDTHRQVREIGDPPSPDAVLTAHLTWRVGAVRTAEFGAVDDVASLIPGRSPTESPLVRAADAARMLAETTGSADEAVKRVADRLALNDVHSFHRWFEELGDIDTQCLAVSVAVFGGEPHESVAALGRALQRRLQPPQSPDNLEMPRSSPLAATGEKRLARLHAARFAEEVSARYGGVPGRVVRYLDPGVPRRVLEQVWAEYDQAQAELPAWLRQCARNELPSVRVRAAVAVGVLAEAAFDTVRTTVLQQWAADTDPRLRDAAATALSTAVRQPCLDQAVRDLVRGWAAEQGSTALCATAARAWTVLLDDGAEGDEPALRLLDQLADVDGTQVVEAICLSIAECLAMAGDSRHRQAFALMRNWTAAREPRRRVLGELAFLYAAADLREERRGDEQDGAPHSWPALLAMSARDPVRQREIAALWETVLNSSGSYETAYGVLGEWARAADPDPAARRAFARLLERVSARPRARRIVLFLADRWTRSGEAAAPRSAAEIRALLNGKTR
ncbi:hypothetical protein [Streptomonospora salina]|uniref:Uncharacterized protein n=1 Tax=Streptomonospora salina TaxID=104205 RepID=A0A841EFI5_9ACTN|nr:hypothetical protein [Streptomonospora salina]MBB5998171.1 hypothetical protein [Streptomonospora salina]